MSDKVTTHHPQSGSVDEEFFSAMNSVAIADRSPAGKISVTGAGGLDLLHRLSTNDLLQLRPFSATATVFTNNKGRIVDYVKVLVLPDSILLVSLASHDSRLIDWIHKYIIMEDIQLTNVTAEWTMYSIVGPEAVSSIKSFVGRACLPGGVHEILLGQTAAIVCCEKEFGLESINILAPSDKISDLNTNLKEWARSNGIRTLTNEAYECFRIFNGIPLGDHELIDDYNPFEAGLHHAISFTKGCYVGQEVIARLDTYQKIQKELVRVTLGVGSDDVDTPVDIQKEGENIGRLTSLSSASVRGEYFGLGIVRKEMVDIGDTIRVKSELLDVKGVISEIFNRSRH
jgi:tRNA-modifying protein YgfZ